MIEPDFVPEQPSEQHFQIAQKAAERLGRLVDGNGLKAEQVRLARHETLVHQLPGEVRIVLKPDIVKGQLKGNRPHGLVAASQAEIMGKAEGLAQEFIADHDVQQELMQVIDKDPARGWGVKPFKHPLAVTRKEFSVVDKCLKCAGQTFFNCNMCHATGNAPCSNCAAQGQIQCNACFGAGAVQLQDGSRAPCGRCQSTGRLPCTFCKGLKQVRCTTCAGDGRIGCTECDQSGYWTHIYDMTFHAEAEFDIDRQQVPPDVLAVVDRLGVRNLATEGHAEVFRLQQNPEAKHLIVPFIAFLPLCNAEFSIEGKQYPSGIAGLTGRIMGIDPVLDPVLKPGINALFKLSKGPLAVEALIDQACKFRVLRQIISGLAHTSKKQVYQGLAKDYPLVISDKYLKGAIKYADIGILALGKGPRIKGLALGTVAAAGLYAGYYLTPLHAAVVSKMAQMQMAQFEMAPDIAIWLCGYIIAWLAVKFMAAGALKKLLPDSVVNTEEKGLPAAGAQGMHALGTTIIAWAILAFMAAQKPLWVAKIIALAAKTHG